MNFITVFDTIIKTGGASYNINTSELNPKTGFFVSLAGFEKATSIPTNLNRFQDIVQSYLTSEILSEIGESPNIYLGFWVHQDTLFLDLSELFEDRTNAIREGYNRHQKAIYDNKNKESIIL